MGLRTGAEYLAALRDERQIIYDGQPLDDVTTAPGFRHTAHAVAQYYDFQHLCCNRPQVRANRIHSPSSIVCRSAASHHD
jgi:aromatic ring hydroxylase